MSIHSTQPCNSPSTCRIWAISVNVSISTLACWMTWLARSNYYRRLELFRDPLYSGSS